MLSKVGVPSIIGKTEDGLNKSRNSTVAARPLFASIFWDPFPHDVDQTKRDNYPLVFKILTVSTLWF
jgi:hypothetical protein